MNDCKEAHLQFEQLGFGDYSHNGKFDLKSVYMVLYPLWNVI